MKLTKKAVEGTAWVSITFGVGKILTFTSSVILARLLSPVEFGLIGAAMIVINYLDILGDLGVGKALIYKQDRINEAASTAFWISCMNGVLVLFLANFISPMAATFFGIPEVKPLMQFLAVSILITLLGSTHHALLSKELAFRKKAIPDLATVLTRGIVSIILAWLGWGVWSLAWGMVIGRVSSAVVAWMVLPWRPSLSFDLKIAKELTSYGSHMTASFFISALGLNADYLFIGKLLGSAALGFYTVAFRIPQLIVDSIVMITSKVTFPAYSKLQGDPQVLQRAFLVTLKFISLLIFPIGIGLFVVAPDLIRVVYTDKWAPAIPVLQILAIFAIVHSIGRSMESVYKGMGRPDIVTKTTIPRTILLFLTLWWGVSAYGILGAALAQLIIAIVISSMKLFIVHRVLGIKLSDIFGEMRIAFLSSMAMLSSIELFLYFAPPMSGLVRLILVSTLGASIYTITVWITGRETVLLARKLIGFAPEG